MLLFCSMNRMNHFKGIYLVIAFAIFWLSFASIIQFHISKIYGKDLTSTVEFVKSVDHHSLKKISKIFHQSNLDDGVFLVDENKSKTHFNQLQRTLILVKNETISHCCVKVRSLRGPPSLFS